MPTKPSRELQTFPNPFPQRDYLISMECPEFTCVCPMTGQPDFGTLYITYIPDKLCVELKAIKLYLWSYRDEGTFHEAVTNQILEDFVHACAPRQITIQSDFKVRGGIHTCVTVNHPHDQKPLTHAVQATWKSEPVLIVSGSSMLDLPAKPASLPAASTGHGFPEVQTVSVPHEIGHRPWGNYETMAVSGNHKVKRVTVLPGKRLSLQRHRHRTEHWVIVQGDALFTLEGQERRLVPGDVVGIPVYSLHRIQNCGNIPLVFVETQRGDYLGEDDIERLEDDYGRSEKK